MLSNLNLLQVNVQSIATRVTIQNALSRYNKGNNTDANWVNAQIDLSTVFNTGGPAQFTYQGRVYAKNDTGLAGPWPVLNVTGMGIPQIALPYKHANGTQVYLGDVDQGFPEPLYPQLDLGTRVINSTFSAATASHLGREITESNRLLLGPWELNETFALCSITQPILNNTASIEVLGWETIVFSADLLYQVADNVQGIGSSGVVLIVGPATANNIFPPHILSTDPPVATNASQQMVRFVVPPLISDSQSTRHKRYSFPSNQTFPLGAYPAASQVFTNDNNALNNGGSFLDTTNEEGDHVSVGFATLQSTTVNWAVIVEDSYDQVTQPTVQLRNVIVACLFGTLGVVLVCLFPVAHYFVRPIHMLRVATLKTVDPYAYPSENSDDGASSLHEEESDLDPPEARGDEESLPEVSEKPTFLQRITRKMPGRLGRPKRRKSPREGFRIPGKVPDRKHIVQDELTDLTTTFNTMVEELMMQYERLEEKVRERTAELELSKVAAEAANESKTLFIANISHELKTPLNGILGMCAVCMGETDPVKIKRSLGIIYKSGDLLLNLLTDLLTFSKNQIGQQLNLDEREFRLADVSSQVLSIFDKQAKEASIDLRVKFEGPNQSLETSSGTPAQTGYGPFGTGRVKDMYVWGDQHRILQVVINLVSNSLKFTPAGGSILVRIRCVGEYNEEKPPSSRNSRKGSSNSRQSKNMKLKRNSSESSKLSGEITGKRSPETNGREAKNLPQIHLRERSLSPTPLNMRTLLFEFEVEDTGPGIPPAQQQKVFEPFVQGDLGLSKKYGGTGLGLSICSQLASLMRGSISLHSVEGEGSTFTMRIPLRYIKERADSTASSSMHHSSLKSFTMDTKPEVHTPRRSGSDSNLSTHSAPTGTVLNNFESSASKPRLVGLSTPFFAATLPPEAKVQQLEAIEKAAAAVSKSGQKIKVLVAEDNQVNQEVVLRMLRLEDIYDVTVAKDGQEAFDYVKVSMEEQKLYDLIFMDIQMPNLDGLQSTRLIREMGYSAPIVALTAFAEESNVQECMDSGMNFFLAKPIRRPALKQVLKRYCSTIPEEEPESPPSSVKAKEKLAEKQANGTGDSANLEPPQEESEDANQLASEQHV